VRTRFRLFAAAAAVVFLAAGRPPIDAGPTTNTPAPASDPFFPLGWYAGLGTPRTLIAVQREGLNAVMPYYGGVIDPAVYLEGAKRLKVKVLLEIDRELVRSAPESEVAAFVARYKDKPALLGWYLADEPSTTRALGPLSPERAKRLYDAIKAQDPDHPVAMAFGIREDPRLYADAMDWPMFDDYPFGRTTPEFGNLAGWWRRLSAQALMVRDEEAFIPVLQGFGGELSPAGFYRRLPTAREERYMVYASIQAGATGIFFWTRYRADETWVREVIVPLVAELRPLQRLLARGERSSPVWVDDTDVALTELRDPSSGDDFVLLVNHDNDPIDVRVRLDPSALGATTLPGDEPAEVSNGILTAQLEPYDALMFQLVRG
jgi:hypothetical protein